jgi:hypothetical protein
MTKSGWFAASPIALCLRPTAPSGTHDLTASEDQPVTAPAALAPGTSSSLPLRTSYT